MSTIWNTNLDPWLCIVLVWGCCCVFPLGFMDTSSQPEVDFSANFVCHLISSKIVSNEAHNFDCEAYWGISNCIAPSSTFRFFSNCNVPFTQFWLSPYWLYTNLCYLDIFHHAFWLEIGTKGGVNEHHVVKVLHLSMSPSTQVNLFFVTMKEKGLHIDFNLGACH